VKARYTSAAAALILGGACAVAGQAALAQALDDKAALAIMKKGACDACHSIDKKGVGPSYREVAKKRKGEKDAAATLAKKIRAGGSGAYGQIPMPPNPPDKVSDQDIKQMVAWILTK
jgi:cytochrome c